jgi:DNA modification methylase
VLTGAKGPVGIAELIRTSCPPNGVVVDLTLGAGSGAVAAVCEGRRYFGFDKSWEAVQVCVMELGRMPVWLCV